MKKVLVLIWSVLLLSVFPSIGYASNPQVVDFADLFTGEEEQALSERIEEIKEAFQADLVIYTDTSSYGVSHGLCAADFYEAYEYGVGDELTGSILFICMEPDNRGWFTAATGSCEYLYTEKVINQIDDRIEPEMVDGNFYDAMNLYLDCVEELYQNGEIPEDRSEDDEDQSFAWIVGVVLALILAAVPVGIGVSMMNTVSTASMADEYLVNGSFRLRKSRDVYLYSHVDRIRKKEPESSKKSSYSSHQSSSSGKSFSGGGRKF